MGSYYIAQAEGVILPLAPTDLWLQAPNTSPGLQELLKDSLLWKILNTGKWREKNNEPIYSYSILRPILCCLYPDYLPTNYPLNCRHPLSVTASVASLKLSNSTYAYMNIKTQSHYHTYRLNSYSLLAVASRHFTYVSNTMLSTGHIMTCDNSYPQRSSRL